MDYINVNDPRETITYAYENIHNTKKISSITPLVYKFFKKNDPLGVYLINHAIEDLIKLVTPLINEFYCDDESLLFTYSGSIISELEYVKNTIVKKLQVKYPKIIPVDPVYDSAVGALIIGWNKFNVSYKENLSNSYKA
jgi:N-acetylglucosamine kinase-like BadF-type ATPase